MSLRIVDLGRTARMLMRSATLIVPSSSHCASTGYSDMALERALTAVLVYAVDASDLYELDFGRDGAFKYFPWSR